MACQEGFGYPTQLPPDKPPLAGVPVAQALGPPLPANVVVLYPAALQKLFTPYVELYPTKATTKELAQESSQGISGT
jgi:hypothetical protein